jgi:hypothetical protein
MAPLDRSRLRTYRLTERKSKVHVSRFGRPHRPGDPFARFLQTLPGFLGAEDMKEVSQKVVRARSQGKPVLLGMGAHVIKVGLSPIVIDLFREGWLSALATNGAGMVHDFEIAVAGHTSEDVDAALGTGEFGMAEETGRILNRMIREGVSRGEGLGEAVGKRLRGSHAPFQEYSLLATGAELGRSVTVHVAVGTDVHHVHAEADGASLGEGSYRDFLRFCERVAALDGGVFINLGSAVLLPEVFLKAVSLARNLGNPLGEITTVNMDFIQHYRPLTNVVRRPTAMGGRGYALTGHHEIMVPLLAATIKEEAMKEGLVPVGDPLP